MEKEKIQGTQSINRAFDIVRHLRRHDGVTLTQISKALNLYAPTTHRLLKVLVAENVVKKVDLKYFSNIAYIR